jgi:hypothetical protein
MTGLKRLGLPETRVKRSSDLCVYCFFKYLLLDLNYYFVIQIFVLVRILLYFNWVWNTLGTFLHTSCLEVDTMLIDIQTQRPGTGDS